MVKKTRAKSKRVVKTKEKEENVAISEKISRLFYSWVKKKVKTKGLVVAEQFELKQQIGAGTFGNVYLASNIYTNAHVAAKMEPSDATYPQLKLEYKIYERLGGIQDGFLKVFFYGPVNKYYNCLIMELLGPDLDDLYEACNHHFSEKTVLMIAMRTIKLIRHVHSRNIVYRDIKPENFCIGHQYDHKEKVIYLIDFGLAKVYEDSQSMKVIPYREYSYLIGTARYMSINALCGMEQARRDDMEALGYMYVYLLYGKLPWMGLSNNETNEIRYHDIRKMKMETTTQELCPDYPYIGNYLDYCKKLNFQDEPDYNYCLSLIDDAMKHKRYADDGIYDWTPIMAEGFLKQAVDVDPDD